MSSVILGIGFPSSRGGLFRWADALEQKKRWKRFNR